MTHPVVASPRVSVCIPTYNGREHLKACIDSIRAQSFKDFEVVICDDQSADGTLELARELAQGDGRFRFIANPQRFGLVGNWNNCVAVARGEWIKFVFQDDIIALTCVEKLLQACESTGKPFSFCARDFIFEDGTVESLRKSFLLHQAQLDSRYLNQSVITAEDAGRMGLENAIYNLVGEPTVTLIQRSVFQQVGLFDDALIQLCDAEFWFRIMSNLGAVWVPERLAAFRIHSKAATGSNLNNRLFRMQVLDPLLVLYRVAFDRHFSRLRSIKLPGKSGFNLWKECALAAYYARRQAGRGVISEIESDRNLIAEWKAVTLFCPRLPLLAQIGQSIAGYDYAKRAAGRLVKGCGFELSRLSK